MHMLIKTTIATLIIALGISLSHATITVKNSGDNAVTIRAYYENVSAGRPFFDFTLSPDNQVEIDATDPHLGNLLSIGVPEQTVSMETWQAVEQIIQDPVDESTYTIDLVDGRWKVVE
jgi:hypothetical protein